MPDRHINDRLVHFSSIPEINVENRGRRAAIENSGHNRK